MAGAWRPARPMRFVHLSTFYPPYAFGGDAVYVYRLAHALADEGNAGGVVHCVDSYRLLHPEPPAIRFDDHPRVRRHELRSRLGLLSPLLTHQTGRPWLKQRRLRQVLSGGPFDVLQFHNASLLGPGAFGL